ncbi:adenine phosphoribosyltransferase [Verruconis gallopava]|uniref:adenine phosphoribosyltransferase n=1 Tax=Verruconis gallopava TaxID=253628 RepID=A0A0D2A1W3_9PEZI|nr:adenine phosphoribosyltransferase [Verruconis gallopava]KIW00748.1 adenine phosphoribosyltransferase [Verruconis gallopava]
MSNPPSQTFDSASSSTRYNEEQSSTSAHPPSHHPDPTVQDTDAAKRGLPSASAASSSELSSLKISLRNALRQFPDFPSPGILFEDILPIFANYELHESLVRALELHVKSTYAQTPDVIVGLDARGFLFGPSLALRLKSKFVPVRKRGKLPGPTVTASYQKEYGEDFFQMQSDGIAPGERVLVVDDIIATGGSAAAAGSLVKQLGGSLLGYVFILELDFLKGRDKLDAPVFTLLTGQEEKST